jgi:hypothetical protein
MEPVKASAWVDPGVVAGFAASTPNLQLIEYAGHQLIGAGAATIVRLPATVPHALDASTAARMLLVMLRVRGTRALTTVARVTASM